MKRTHTLLAILLTVSATTRAQNVPAASGSATSEGAAELQVSGKLHYDLRYAQTARLGSNLDGQQRSYISGDASYANIRKRMPFTMRYGGGYGWVLAGPPSAGNVFQHMALSQGYVKRTWNLTASENVSYTFETPTTGFLGGSGSTTSPDQTVLTQNTRILDNVTTLGFGHKLNYATSLNIDSTWGQMRFINRNGQRMDTKTASASVTRRLDAHNSLSGQYSFSRFFYGGSSALVNSAQVRFSQINTAKIGLNRQWNRKIKTTVSVGPQWISTANGAAEPSSTRISITAFTSYAFRAGTASMNYSHESTGGAGYMPGAENDIAAANLLRKFGKNLSVGVTGTYMRTAGLNKNGVIRGEYGGVQASRRLGRYFSIFTNYTATDQSSTFQNSANILTSLSQIFGFGISYSPREKHFND